MGNQAQTILYFRCVDDHAHVDSDDGGDDGDGAGYADSDGENA